MAQCTATSKTTGRRCRNEAVKGSNVCRFHGARGGAPVGSQNAMTHGFWSKIMPKDPELLALAKELTGRKTSEILWESIVIQYLAICRAQKIMYVKDQEDLTKVVKRHRVGAGFEEIEFELQHSWDKHATFLKAQALAMNNLERMLRAYEELQEKDLGIQEKKARIAKLNAEVNRLTGAGDELEDDGFIEALGSTVLEVWSDGAYEV